MIKPSLIFFFMIACSSYSNNSLDSLYNILDQAMIKSQEYDMQKELRIDNLIFEIEKSKLLENQYKKRKKLIDEYQYYDLNKAIENIKLI